jgi:hypothetical protein
MANSHKIASAAQAFRKAKNPEATTSTGNKEDPPDLRRRLVILPPTELHALSYL